MKEKDKIRQTRIEVFMTLTTRALLIVESEDSKLGTLLDACRLIETALKAIENVLPPGDASSETESDEAFLGDIARVFVKQNTENPVARN